MGARFLVVTALLLSAGAASARRAPVRVQARASGQCTPAWATVDNVILPGAERAAAAKVLVTPSEVLVVGTSWTSDVTSSWVARRSKEGTSWTTVDDFLWSVGVSAHPEAIARDATQLYVAGGANVVGSQAGPWLVRASGNGEDWSTVDQVEDPALPSATAHAATVDAGGVLLVGGARLDSESGQYRWVLRASSTQGASWSVVDDDGPTVGATGISALAVDPASGRTYAAGYDWDGYQYRWKVRAGAGSAWSTVDSFTLAPTPAVALNGSTPAGVVVGEAGAVFVAGTAFDIAGGAHWLVRRSLDGGGSWSIADDPFGSSQRCGARAITYDPSARTLYVVGRCHDGSSYRWLTRASADNGATWTTQDEFTLSAGQDAWASGVAVATDGRVFVAGAAKGADGALRWVLRRRSCK